MRFTSTINMVRLVEWEINITQGALVDLINQASSWAKAVVIDGVTYYWMSFSKVCEELPAVFNKEDTVYRQYKVLKEKGIIEHFKMDGKDYVRLTEKGCDWNKFEPIRVSEKNPSIGNNSTETRKKIRESSEKNPTDNNTNYKNINDQIPLTPETGEPAPEKVVLNYLNLALATLAEQLGERKPVGFSFKPWEKNIAARIRESSVEDCCRVVDYLVAKWGRDGKMREYLCPKTIFRQSNFADYLPKSVAWAERGKPVCIKDKWVSTTEAEKRLIMPSVEEVKGLYLKSLGFGNPFKSLDFSDKRNLVMYHAAIATKSKRPLEREINMVIAREINNAADKVAELKVPVFQ